MDSHVNLTLASAEYKSLAASQLSGLSKFPIKFATPIQIKIEEGKILRQSYNHMYANVDLYEFSLDKEATVSFTTKEPSMCMVIVLKGKMKLTTQKHRRIISPQVPYCRLQYSDAYNYPAHLCAGDHKILFLVLNREWFKRIAAEYPSLQQITDAMENSKPSYMYMPACVVVREIVRSLKRLESKHLNDKVKREAAVSLFLSQVIKYYDTLVTGRQYVAEEGHQLKGKEIRAFIEANYSENIVDNKQQMARKLFVSISQLMRLSLKEFEMPLHEYIMFYRNTIAFKELLLTTKTISEIAREVGYTDPLYFSKVFKKRYRISPSEVFRLKDN